MSVLLPSPERVEEHRAIWSKVAKENGWYRQPFYVQVWYDTDGEITDSVSYRDLDRDYLIEDEDSFDYAICRSCSRTINLDTESWSVDNDETYCDHCK